MFSKSPVSKPMGAKKAPSPPPPRPGSGAGRRPPRPHSPSPQSSPSSSPALYSSSPPPPSSHPHPHPHTSSSAHHLAPPLSSPPAHDLEHLTSLLFAAYAASDASSFNAHLTSIRSSILFHGIPPTPSPSPSPSPSPPSHTPSLRGRLWQVFLGLGPISASTYISLTSLGRCAQYAKIRGDSFRTFPQDEQFVGRVREEEIVRLLNAFVHQHGGEGGGRMGVGGVGVLGGGVGGGEGDGSGVRFTYCQGMNTIAAPMLYCMGELSAYFAFSAFITRATPLYWLSSHIGVQAGCRLVDRCLQSIDPELHAHLTSHHLHSLLYAFHCVSSFSASVPPFSQLLTLWDFLLAFGPHLNILAVTAQVIALRQTLLASPSPKSILDYRKWPPLRSRTIIAMCMSFVSHIDAELYDDIRWHASDREVAERITGRKVELGVRD